MARKRTQAQIDAETAYLAANPPLQINLKFKTAADIKMVAKLRKRFPGMKDTGIARLAIKELAGKGNK